MTVPLIILAALSIIGGWIGWPGALGGENRFERFLEPVLAGVISETGAVRIAHHAVGKEIFLMVLSLSMAGAGIWLAYEFYRSKRIAPQLVAEKWPKVYELLVHKYYVDEIYDALIVNRVKDLGVLLGVLDANVIDGLGVNGAGWLARFSSKVSMWWDKWVIDGLLNFGAKLTQLFSYPVRLLQTGLFSSYALLILVGLVVLLGYYGHHMQTLLRAVR
jgi:NADH-quinone oxidoreductase subunit L